MSEKPEKSIGWVIWMSSIVVAVIGWCMLASGYTDATEGLSIAAADDSIRPRRARAMGVMMLVQFSWNGITQLPNALSVISYAFSQKFGIVVLIFALETLILVGGWKMKALEKELNRPRR